MNNFKIIGTIIIGLVITAFFTTPEFFTNISLISHLQVIIMILLLLVVCVTTIIMVIGKPVSDLFLVKLIVGLFLISASVFFGNEEYFSYAIDLPLSFWHRVSFYTLPVIAFESALITGFILFLKQNTFTRIERILTYGLFGFYSAVTFAVNFMTLGKIFFTIENHIAIARIVIITFAIIAPAVIYKTIYRPA